jgi:hypothetical protein
MRDDARRACATPRDLGRRVLPPPRALSGGSSAAIDLLALGEQKAWSCLRGRQSRHSRRRTRWRALVRAHGLKKEPARIEALGRWAPALPDDLELGLLPRCGSGMLGRQAL